ncbi:HpcH/HpaI aldolase/citrate lyase family protein [Dietzia kunjamensis]|uniref:HpcH/HpaI aldolase/citrate lyase family protein n=1 Tax=Dietzia kunjamensis TaxID=322509 RepID=UPI002097ADE1|nr:CoA ester lyase [Dietzia kunjamensis]USX44612.1 CoA ester lyase [Dietzia kunjamensis]
MDPIDHAPTPCRATLVCPGSAPEKITKALASPADEVVVDLEDAVAPARKDEARRALGDLSPRPTGTLAVRVNAPGTPWFADDLRAVAALGATVASVVIPKVDSPSDLEEVERILDIASAHGLVIQALVETARGLRDVEAVADAGGRLVGLILGYADLGAELGRSPGAAPELWLAIQDRVLVAARAAGIQAIDGPALYTSADDRLRSDAGRTAALGFDGKWVIHPGQIASVTEAYTPTDEELARAREVLDALSAAENSGHGAVGLDGMMLDEAVAVAARRTLARAGGA